MSNEQVYTYMDRINDGIKDSADLLSDEENEELVFSTAIEGMSGAPLAFDENDNYQCQQWAGTVIESYSLDHGFILGEN